MDEQTGVSALEERFRERLWGVGVLPPKEEMLPAIRSRQLRRGLTAVVRGFESGGQPSDKSDKNHVWWVGTWLEIAVRLGDTAAVNLFVAWLLRFLDCGNWWLKPEACMALAPAANTHAAARAALVEHLKYISPSVQEAVYEALATDAASHTDARAPLIARLEEDYQARKAPHRAVTTMMKTMCADVRAMLIRRLGDQAKGVRVTACQLLTSAAMEHADARTALIQRLDDRAFEVRQAACTALGAAAVMEANVRTALMKRLMDNSLSVRAAACRALAPAATDADVRRKLLERLEDKKHDVREAAMVALTSLPPSSRLRDLSAFRWRWWSTARREAIIRLLQVLFRPGASPSVFLSGLALLAVRGTGKRLSNLFFKLATDIIWGSGQCCAKSFAQRVMAVEKSNVKPVSRRVLGGPPPPVSTKKGKHERSCIPSRPPVVAP